MQKMIHAGSLYKEKMAKNRWAEDWLALDDNCTDTLARYLDKLGRRHLRHQILIAMHDKDAFHQFP